MAGSAGTSYTAETITWYTRIAAIGGSVTTTDKDLADALIRQIQAASYGSNIVYLLPFLGNNIKAASVPLRDSLAVGAATITGFVDADCGNSIGLNNATEANKWLDSLIKPSQLGSSNNGGLGWYMRSWGNGTNVEPMGTYSSTNSPDQRFVLDLRSSIQRFRWGAPANAAGPGTTTSAGHYYGQRSSATLRRIYKDGITLGTDSTTSDSASRANEQNIIIHGCRESNASSTYVVPYKARSGCAYLTNGSLSDADVAAFHTLLGTYLITPTGR